MAFKECESLAFYILCPLYNIALNERILVKDFLKILKDVPKGRILRFSHIGTIPQSYQDPMDEATSGVSIAIVKEEPLCYQSP